MRNKTTPFQDLREEHGYTTSKLAKRMNVYPMTVTGWDHGAIPAGDRLVLLAELFNTSPAYVLRVIGQSKKGNKAAIPA